MEKRIKITAEQLEFLTEDCRELINKFIIDNGYSNNKASIIFGVHPAQLSLFLKSNQGFNIKTLQKIGKIISDHYNSK